MYKLTLTLLSGHAIILARLFVGVIVIFASIQSYSLHVCQTDPLESTTNPAVRYDHSLT